MGPEFEVGTRPLDGVCPDCGRVIRDGVWFRHRQVAHGATLTLAPTTGASASEGPDAPVVFLRPTDGVCPDCGRRIAPELWDNHRQHVHGTGRPTTTDAPVRGGARGAAAPSTRKPAVPAPDLGLEAKRAGLAWTISFAVTALVAFGIYLGDVTSWAEKSESCQVVGHVRRATTPQTPQSCGFYAVAASFQSIALIVGILALVLAFVAPLIPAVGGTGRQR